MRPKKGREAAGKLLLGLGIGGMFLVLGLGGGALPGGAGSWLPAVAAVALLGAVLWLYGKKRR